MPKEEKEEFEKAQKGNLYKVDSRSLIVDDNFNEREDYGDIPGLAAEIEAQGVTMPLKCYKQGEHYVVIRGHRRRAALVYLLEKKGLYMLVPTILVEKNKSNPEDWVLDQITSNGGKSLTPWEQAKVLKRLVDYGWSEKDIIEKSGKSNVYVKRLLSLAAAPQKLINMVKEKTVSATFAMDAISDGKVAELIAKAEVGPIAHPLESFEMFPPDPTPTRPERITRGDLKPNSWKIFRKWSPNVKKEELPPAKAEIFDFMKKMEAGELTEEDFNKFFGE